VVKVTGLRNPCPQIEGFKEGLLGRCAVGENGKTVEREARIMGIVERGGVVRSGARIVVQERWFWKRRKMGVV
jgi:MOSC domain-containing protein YiiM